MQAERTSALGPNAWRIASMTGAFVSGGRQTEVCKARSGVETGGGGGGGIGGSSSGSGPSSSSRGRRRAAPRIGSCDDRLPRSRTGGRDGLAIEASSGTTAPFARSYFSMASSGFECEM